MGALAGVAAASGISAAAAGVMGAAALGAAFEVQGAVDQRRIEKASINLQAEQAKLIATQEAEQNASSFRSALASQVAMTSFRGGSGSLTRQFGAESFSNFMQDRQKFESNLRLIELQKGLQQSQSKAAQTARIAKGVTGGAKSAFGLTGKSSTTKSSTSGL